MERISKLLLVAFFCSHRGLGQERNLQESITVWRKGIGTEVLGFSVLSPWPAVFRAPSAENSGSCLDVDSSFPPIILIQGALVPLEDRVTADLHYLSFGKKMVLRKKRTKRASFLVYSGPSDPASFYTNTLSR